MVTLRRSSKVQVPALPDWEADPRLGKFDERRAALETRIAKLRADAVAAEDAAITIAEAYRATEATYLLGDGEDPRVVASARKEAETARAEADQAQRLVDEGLRQLAHLDELRGQVVETVRAEAQTTFRGIYGAAVRDLDAAVAAAHEANSRVSAIFEASRKVGLPTVGLSFGPLMEPGDPGTAHGAGGLELRYWRERVTRSGLIDA